MPTYEEAIQQAYKLYEERKFVQSEELIDHLLGMTQKDYRVQLLAGGLHLAGKRYGHAINFLGQAVSLNKNSAESWDALGTALRCQGHEDSARHCYRKAIEIDPTSERYGNLGGTFVNAGDPVSGIKVLKKALDLNPDNYRARNNLGLCQLELGQFSEGFESYRYRKHHNDWSNRDFGKIPEWDGKPTDCLLIHGEQGLGDEVMFLTCFEDAKKLVKSVAVEVNPRLVGLMQNSLGVKCYPDHKRMMEDNPATAWVAMGDLPYWFRRDGKFPDGVYLKPEYLYPRGKKLRIGVSWMGGTRDTHSYHRNFPVDWWKPLLEKDADWVSLQYGTYGSTESKQLGIPHDQEWIDDLHKFAALVKSCDLVITVCNTTVHFAGALGVPCWVFTPSAPAWRYGIDGPMPWYKSVELFRQAKGEDWREVVARVKTQLEAF